MKYFPPFWKHFFLHLIAVFLLFWVQFSHYLEPWFRAIIPAVEFILLHFGELFLHLRTVYIAVWVQISCILRTLYLHFGCNSEGLHKPCIVQSEIFTSLKSFLPSVSCLNRHVPTGQSIFWVNLQQLDQMWSVFSSQSDSDSQQPLPLLKGFGWDFGHWNAEKIRQKNNLKLRAHRRILDEYSTNFWRRIVLRRRKISLWKDLKYLPDETAI